MKSKDTDIILKMQAIKWETAIPKTEQRQKRKALCEEGYLASIYHIEITTSILDTDNPTIGTKLYKNWRPSTL